MSDDEESRFNIGEITLKWRKKERVSQKDLAARIGASKVYLCKLEKNKIKKPSFDVVVMIARAFNKKISEFIGEDSKFKEKNYESFDSVVKRVYRRKRESMYNR